MHTPEVRKYQAHLAASAADIDRVEWDAIWPEGQEGHAYHLVQDQAGIPGFEFGYMTLRHEGRLVLVAPLYVAPFDMRLALEGSALHWLTRARRVWPGLMVWRTLFCGGFATERSVIAVAQDLAPDPNLWKALDLALRQHAARKRARMIVLKDFDASELDSRLAPMGALGYGRSDALPMPVLDLPFASLEEYLDSLSSGTRKDLKRKLKQTESRGGVVVESVNAIDAVQAQQLHALYRQVHDRTDLHFETLTPAYFQGFGQFQAQNTVYFLYYAEHDDARRLIGFNLCTVHDGRLMDKYIGMDYALAHEYNLYFVSFLYNVRWCIAQGVRAYVLNQGGYELKTKFGAVMHPLAHMTRMVHPLLHFFQKRFA